MTPNYAAKPAENLNSAVLRTFSAVAETRSFTKAASQLGISQQVVSGHIRTLEDKLQTVLLERQAGGARLSPAGEALLPYARQAVASLDALFAKASHQSAPIRLGEIRNRKIIQKIWQTHRSLYPEHLASFNDLTGDEQVDGLMSGDIDVAMHSATRIEPRLRQAFLLLDPIKVFHIQPLDTPRLRGNSVACTAASTRFSSWRDFCVELARDFEASLVPIPHDITMLEAIGQEMIQSSMPPALVLEGMQDYAESESFYFTHFEDCQPYYPWAISIRRGEVRSEVIQFFETALQLSASLGWTKQVRSHVPQWFPRGLIEDDRVSFTM